MNEDEELKLVGYYPGGYFCICDYCGEQSLFVAKRVRICRNCALEKLEEYKLQETLYTVFPN
jgi:uncharacterized protein (DUF983 family)